MIAVSAVWGAFAIGEGVGMQNLDLLFGHSSSYRASKVKLK